MPYSGYSYCIGCPGVRSTTCSYCMCFNAFDTVAPFMFQQGCYCPTASTTYYTCPAGYYCPASSALYKACPGGWYQLLTLARCPAWCTFVFNAPHPTRCLSLAGLLLPLRIVFVQGVPRRLLLPVVLRFVLCMPDRQILRIL